MTRKSSRFTPNAFLQSLLAAVAMARQSFHERLGPKSTAVLLTVLGALMEQRLRPAAMALAGGLMRRFLVEDSSFVSLPKSGRAILC